MAARFAYALALLVATVAAPTPTPAEPRWLPLDIGNRWSYVGIDFQEAEEITGTITLFGRTLYVKTYLSGPDAGLENYWELADDGSVRIGGFKAGDFSLGYDPPVMLLATPPSVGLEWVSHTTLYSLPDLEDQGPLDVVFRVTEDVELQVPAGAFQCFGVGQVPPPSPVAAALRGYTLDGRRNRAVPRYGDVSPIEWYSADVGLVQYNSSDTYQLESFDRATPTVASTWGRLKRLYR